MNFMKSIFFILSLLPSIVLAQDPVGAKYRVLEGVELHDEGKYADALKKYDLALALDANNMDAFTEKALTLEMMGYSKEAIELCKKTIKLYSKDVHPTLYVTYGNALDHSGHPEKAVKIYKEGIGLFPNNYQLYFNQGITLVGLQQLDKATQSIQKATMLNPNHPGSFNALSFLYQNNRIAAILASCRYLSLDNSSQRAKVNYDFLLENLYQGVTKTNSDNISIVINENQLNNAVDKKLDDNFVMTEMILSMTAAMSLSDDTTYKTQPQKVAAMLTSVFVGLQERSQYSQGYFNSFLVPYFLDMKAKNLIEPFSNIILIVVEDPDAINFYKENREKLTAFYEWSKAYKWKTN